MKDAKTAFRRRNNAVVYKYGHSILGPTVLVCILSCRPVGLCLGWLPSPYVRGIQRPCTVPMSLVYNRPGWFGARVSAAGAALFIATSTGTASS
jgi:hypothetical protein